MGCNPIAAARRKLGMSQASLATAIGVRRESVKDWERGVKSPSKAHADSLRTTLGLNDDEMWRVLHFRPKSATAIEERREPIW